MHISPYLNFNGNCGEAMKFYEEVLGGKIAFNQTFEGTPAAEYVPPDFKDKVMHATLQVGTFTIMASDAPPDRYAPPQGFHVSIALADVAESERIFAALSAGGQIEMPLQETFWASRFGMLTDKFGIGWMVNCEKQHG